MPVGQTPENGETRNLKLTSFSDYIGVSENGVEDVFIVPINARCISHNRKYPSLGFMPRILISFMSGTVIRRVSLLTLHPRQDKRNHHSSKNEETLRIGERLFTVSLPFGPTKNRATMVNKCLRLAPSKACSVSNMDPTERHAQSAFARPKAKLLHLQEHTSGQS